MEIVRLENTGVSQRENAKSGPSRCRARRLTRGQSAAEKILSNRAYQAEPDFINIRFQELLNQTDEILLSFDHSPKSANVIPDMKVCPNSRR